MEDTKIITMPVIALRGLTMLPEMTVSFDISRKKSIAAVEKAMVSDQRVCLVAQKDPEIQDPSLEQLYHIGTVSYIKQLVKMPGGIVRVMAEGQERAELLDLDSTEPALIGEVLLTSEQEADVDGAAAEAMSRILKEKLESYGHQHPKFAKEILPGMMVCEDLESLMLKMASDLPWDYRIRQAYLEEATLAGQYEVLLSNLIHEIEVSQIHRELPALCIKMCYDKLTRKSKTFSINFYCLFIVVAISAVRVLSVTSLLVVGILGIYILIDQNAFFQGVLKRIKFTPLSAVIVSVVGTIIVVGGTIASDQIALLQSLTRYFSKGSTINGRGPIWLSALRRITQHLWLGCGYETYDMTSLNLVGTTGWGTSAHNFCLELLYTGGIVLAVTIALIYLVLYYNSKFIKESTIGNIIGIWLILISIMGIVEPQYEEYTRIAWVVSFYLIMIERKQYFRSNKLKE